MKFVTVINKKIPVGNALNVASHMMAGLVATASEDLQQEMAVINYGKDEHAHFASKWPHIMLKARNSNKIQQVVEAAKAHNLHHVTFTSTMTNGDWKTQIENTLAVEDSDIEYYGVALIGDDELIDSFSGKLSLYV